MKSSRHNPSRPSSLFPLITIALISFGVYFNTLFNGFVYDDMKQVLENPWIQDMSYLPDIFSKSVWSFLKNSVTNYYRPMMHVVYMINYHIFGLKPWGFHLVNVLFHVANSVLVFFIAERLLLKGQAKVKVKAETKNERKEQRFSFFSTSASTSAFFSAPFLAALLFATHPIHTEAVAWVAALPELAFTFFCLLSFYFYMGFHPPLNPLPSPHSGGFAGAKREGGQERKVPSGKGNHSAPSPLEGEGWGEGAKRNYLLSVASFFFALLFKETALTFPLVLVACDLAFGGKGQRPGVYAKRYLPYLIVAAIYFLVRYRVLSDVLAPIKESGGLTSYQLIINVLPLFSEYLEKLLLPLNLSFWHSFHPILSLFTVRGAISLGVALLFLCSMVIAWKKNRSAFLALVIILVPLLPAFYLKVLPGKPFAERYLYLPSVGFAILSALLFLWLQGKFRKSIVIFLVFISLAAFYSAGTITRNTIWKDNYLLFSDTVAKAPDAAMPRYDLAVAMMDEKGEFDGAIEQFEILEKTNLHDAKFHSVFGHALLMKNRLDEAIEHLNTAISLDRVTRETYLDLGVALRQQGQTKEAIASYEKALAISPDYAKAHFNLGNAFADSGQMDKAIEHYRSAVRLQPGNDFYRNMLGITYGQKGMYAEAVEQFREAGRLAPAESAYRKNLERAEGLKKSAGKKKE